MMEKYLVVLTCNECDNERTAGWCDAQTGDDVVSHCCDCRKVTHNTADRYVREERREKVGV